MGECDNIKKCSIGKKYKYAESVKRYVLEKYIRDKCYERSGDSVDRKVV